MKDDIDVLFEKYDKSGSGELEKDEVEDLLKEMSQEKGYKGGDVDYIFSICDKNGSGSLTKAELLPAIGTWKKILEMMDDDDDDDGPAAAPGAAPAGAGKKSSSVCTLL